MKSPERILLFFALFLVALCVFEIFRYPSKEMEFDMAKKLEASKQMQKLKQDINQIKIEKEMRRLGCTNLDCIVEKSIKK